jgi:hypothetical protein
MRDWMGRTCPVPIEMMFPNLTLENSRFASPQSGVDQKISS